MSKHLQKKYRTETFKMLTKCLVLCAVFCSIFCGCLAAGPRLATNTVPESYNITLDVDMTNFIFSGSVIITTKATTTNDYIQLHQKDLNVTFKVLTNINDGSELTLKNSVYDLEYEIWTIFFNGNLIKDQFYELTLDFDGNVRNDMKGFFRTTYYSTSSPVT